MGGAKRGQAGNYRRDISKGFFVLCFSVYGSLWNLASGTEKEKDFKYRSMVLEEKWNI